MINTSNEYKRYIADSVDSTLSRYFTAKADIELADSTILNVTEEDIVVKGLKIDDSTSPNNSFQVGSAIINQCTLMLNNIGGKFDQYDFTDAIIRPYIGLRLSETTEWLAKGIFTVDEPTLASSIISLVALDNMEKFDTPFSEVTIHFPCTSLQLLQAVCLHCGVSLATIQYLNSNFVIMRSPDDEATTCREIVAWIGQISGNFARINTQGALELKWYDVGAFEQSDDIDGGEFDGATPYASGDSADGGNFTDYSSGDNVDGGTFEQMKKYHHLYSLNQATIGTDDIIITGVRVKAMGTQEDYGETVLFGSTGYVIEITDNPFIIENTASIIANSIGAKIVGMRFRPCNISVLSDPSREAGDVAYLSHKNNTYQILITNISYQIGKNNSISCGAETPSRKQSVRFDASTKAIIEARKQAKQQLTAYDLSVQQLNSIMTNAMGYYPVQEIQPDGSAIDYMCDKPTLAESQIIWKKSIDGFGVSTDGGATYTAGITADGNIIAKTLSVIGINAEWIKVLTSFTVGTQFSVDALGKLVASNADIRGRITADSGQIGPFSISNRGLFSDIMEFFEDNDYPLIWLTKKGPNGEAWGADGTERANYESAVSVVRAVEDGIQTSVFMQARDDTTGRKGQITIQKSGNGINQELIIDNDGMALNKFDGGNLEESLQVNPSGIFASNQLDWFSISGNFGTLAMMPETAYWSAANCQISMSDSGDIMIHGQKGSIAMLDDIYINAPGTVYVNGIDLSTITTMQSDIAAIKQRIGL